MWAVGSWGVVQVRNQTGSDDLYRKVILTAKPNKEGKKKSTVNIDTKTLSKRVQEAKTITPLCQSQGHSRGSLQELALVEEGRFVKWRT